MKPGGPRSSWRYNAALTNSQLFANINQEGTFCSGHICGAKRARAQNSVSQRDSGRAGAKTSSMPLWHDSFSPTRWWYLTHLDHSCPHWFLVGFLVVT